ncbi:MAG: HEAT repeat domain-containing protein, partial [Phycisphaerae bacterium]|nr:HEAT repeat domain-containing protein [Phycisphaerae bacterium]
MPLSKSLIGVLLLLVLLLAACDKPGASPMDRLARGGKLKLTAADGAAEMPRTYLTAVDALVAASRQTGLRYAVLPPRFDGVVGPFAMGQRVPVNDLLAHVATATGTSVVTINGVAVFEGKSAAPAKELAAAASPQGVYDLAATCQASVIPGLSKLTGSRDERIRLLALRGLAAMEGDFMRSEWPGRVSIFEVLADQLDTQSLLWALEQGGPAGGTQWNLACSILARGRCPQLTRNTWAHVYGKTPGTMQMCLWAIGRVDDPSGAWAIRNRLVKTFTAEPEDAFLAAKSLGQIAPWRLMDHAKNEKDVDARRAAAFGAGFAPKDSKVAEQIIEMGLKDADPTVRFLACQSAARFGGRCSKVLSEIAMDRTRPEADRCSAVAALEASKDLRQLAASAIGGDKRFEPSAAVRAAIARRLGDFRDPSTLDELMRLLTRDTDVQVKAEAARSLGRFGIGERRVVSEHPVRRTRPGEPLPSTTRPLDASACFDSVCGIVLTSEVPLDVRIAAAVGLGQGRSPAAVESLSKVALDPNQPVRLRRYAIRALAMLANHAGTATLARIAPLDSPAHDHEAVRYLDLANPADTAKILIPILTAGEREDAGSAANRLAELGYGPGVRELCEGFDVFDNSGRVMHMWGAIRSRGPESDAALIEAAKSPRTRIRNVAAVALGSRPDPKVVATLIGLCKDTDAGVRHMAAQSLGLTGDPAAVPVLIGLALEDPAPRVASDAIRALRRADWIDRPEVKAAFDKLAGTERDCAVPNAQGKAPSLKDQPAHSFVLRKWPGDYNDLSITNITYESSLTYDSDKSRVVQWGSHGRRADFPQTSETWFYSADKNEWDRLTTSRQIPNGQCLTWGTTYDPSSHSVVSPMSGHGGHGWINNLRANLSHSVPWVFDADSGQWRMARPVRGPGYSMGQVNGVFDTEHDVTIFHHGPMWAYDAYENRFDKLGVGANRPDYGDADGWDPVTARLISLVPGGEHMKSWAFNPANNAWPDLKAAGGPKDLVSRLMYDSTNDVMIGFAGTATRGVRVWIYH